MKTLFTMVVLVVLGSLLADSATACGKGRLRKGARAVLHKVIHLGGCR